MAVAGAMLFQRLFLFMLTLSGGAAHITTHRDTGANSDVLQLPLPPSGRFLSASNLERRQELHEVIKVSLGSLFSSPGARDEFSRVAASLGPMWDSLAKNKFGRIDHRSLRYAVHRYMLNANGVSIVGLEPTASSNQTDDAIFLTSHAPMLIKEALEGSAAGEGFSKADAVALIFLLRHFVKISAETHMLDIFNMLHIQEEGAILKIDTLRRVTQSRFFELILGGDTEGISLLRENLSLAQDFFEDYESLITYVDGSVEAHRRSLPNPFKADYDFDNALEVAGDISLSMGVFWETECERVKDSLAAMDSTGTGRVRLADFHRAALNGEWRFSESKEYLRHLGALDETSVLAGPRVIIANYVQGPSNCIVSTPTFRVCCANDCESHLAEIEAAVKAPAALPEKILAVVSNITSFNDEEVVVSAKMRSQLFDIAQVHNGVVPLHGRLFGQWLHFIFPLECPYPHKAGSMGSMSFFEFGEDSLASSMEIEKHAATATTIQGNATNTLVQAQQIEADWLSQWSHEEELISAQVYLTAPWDKTMLGTMAWPFLLFLAVLSYFAFVVSPGKISKIVAVSLMQGSHCSRDTHAHII